MEHVDLECVIRQTIARFTQNRIGAKPLVFVMLSPSVSQLAWNDGALPEFVRLFLYEALLSNDPDAAVEVLLRRRVALKDMNDFVRIHPSFWIQLRVSGRGLKRSERVIEDLFTGVGYRLEEWVGADHSDARLGIFGTKSGGKMVFYLESTPRALKCDLLLPVFEQVRIPISPPDGATQPERHATGALDQEIRRP
jgi:hypothetical protein